ncbi:MAG: hypothetical protein ABSA17_07630 [Rhabdochlamydiaceae bacterium]|jgi:hypothetical protein
MAKNNVSNVMVPLREENLPLETLKQLLEDDLIQEEIPFEVLANQYPSLLDNWYPGYPVMLRMMTPEDPMCLVGYIKDGSVSFKEMPELGSLSLDMGSNPLAEGEYKVWLKMDKDSWFIHVVVDD